MNEALTKMISGARIAAETPAATSASSLWRLTLRSSCSYSSAGICAVFQERPHFSHCQRSPYATSRFSPHSQLIVIGGFATAPIVRPVH